MPVNRNALIRYRVIDGCLQNRRRKWTIENLIEACNDALFEYDGSDRGVSLRTIRLDLTAMRSNQLGYNAPIIVKDKKYYSYEDPEYSIYNIPLTSQDLNVLQEVSHLLKQFKGFSHFGEVAEMVNKLEDKIYSEKNNRSPVIDFEKNELLTGIGWLDPLYKAIVSESTVQLRYQSFKARAPNDIAFFPYLLKEWIFHCIVYHLFQIIVYQRFSPKFTTLDVKFAGHFSAKFTSCRPKGADITA